MTEVVTTNPEMFVLGQHRFVCADITLFGLGDLMAGDLADVAYSDPPWGPRNQQYWHTMNRRGSEPQTSWPAFLDTFAAICRTHTTPFAPIFVEMGLRWMGDLDRAMGKFDLFPQKRWDILYGPKKSPLPNTLTLYASSKRAVEDSGAFDIVMPELPHGEPVTKAVLSAVVKPGDVVLDPCTGLGMTARITHKLGGVFRGSELNRARLLRAIEGVKKGRRV